MFFLLKARERNNCAEQGKILCRRSQSGWEKIKAAIWRHRCAAPQYMPVFFFRTLFVRKGLQMKNEKKITARKLTVTAVMAAASFILMLLEFSTPFAPSFLKFDFSDLPALITAFALGPIWGAAVELIKNLLHMPFSATACVGELANFIVGAAMVLPAGAVYGKDNTRRGALIGCIVGAVVSAAVSFPVNYFITYPFYAGLMPMDTIIGLYSAIIPAANTLPRALLIVNVPFTLVKCLVSTVITFAVYKKLSPILKGKNSPEKENKA